MRDSLKDRVSNSQDVIDSRDILERISELESELSEMVIDSEDGVDGSRTVDLTSMTAAEREADDDLQPWTDEHEELLTLRKLVEDIDNYAGDSARDSVGLIRDSYFEDHARELADDLGALKNADTWPLTCIDWERAADHLKQDYSAIDYDGVEYWVRS